MAQPLPLDIHNTDHRTAFATAVRKLANVTSLHEGADCYPLTQLAHAALRRLEVDVQIRVGYAGWRLDGECPHACILHHPSFAQDSRRGIPFHAWLAVGDQLFDLTTYQLRMKAAALDQQDGEATPVSWCPDYLWVPESASVLVAVVVRSHEAGTFHYHHDPALAMEVERLADAPDDEFIEGLLAIYYAEVAGRPVHVLGPRLGKYPARA